MEKLPRQVLADLSLTSIGVIWGFSFTVIKFAIGVIPPMQFIGLRFLISAVVLGIVFSGKLRTLNRQELLAGCVIGVFLSLGFLTQTIGLQYTTPGKSGFITSLYIVLVPFMASLVHRKFVGWLPIVGALLAFSGLCLISLNQDFWLSTGDFLSIICAFCYALHILAVEYYSPKYSPSTLVVLQIIFTSLISLGYSLLFEPISFTVPGKVWLAIIFTSLFGTCFALLVQNAAQKYTSSSRAALLMGLEAPFALLFSILIWGENPSFRGITGSLLIFIAIILVEVGPAFIHGRSKAQVN